MAAVAPTPTTVLPFVRSGGHALAHAPVHVLLVPESFWNRYRVRPWGSSRILPSSLLLSTPTVAGRPFAVVGGRGEPVAASPLPPQAAAANAASTSVAAVARNLMSLLGVMLAPLVGSRGFQGR